MEKIRKKRGRRKEGDIFVVNLIDGYHSYGRVLQEPLMVFYNLRTRDDLPAEEVVKLPIAFMIWVMNRTVKSGEWPVIGNVPLGELAGVEQDYFKRDTLNGKIYRVRTGSSEEIPSTKEECYGLECAAVWDSVHVIDRLNDYFANKENIWVKSLSL